MITQQNYDRLHHLATVRKITMQEVVEMESSIRVYINPRYSVCKRCIQQIKHGQKMLLHYLENVEVIENYKVIYDEPLMDELIPITAEPEVDIVEAEKVGCTKCRKKKENKG